MLATLVSVMGYGALTGGAFGPSHGDARPEPAALPRAAMAIADGEMIVTGSIDHIFETEAFVGPNRTEKRDRSRITVDLAAFTAGFERAYGDIAVAAAADQTVTLPAAEPVKVAAVDPIVTGATSPDDRPIASAALDAIAGAVTAGVPTPLIPSARLAYARETAPVTQFSTSPDQLAATDREMWCLAVGIYFEARGESYRGQIAVGQVIMNRVAHKLYPNTICGVVFQGQEKRNACQFSFACDGIPETIREPKAWEIAGGVARGVKSGALYLPEVEAATHYHASYVHPYWAPRLKKLTTIGLHIFYKFKRA